VFKERFSHFLVIKFEWFQAVFLEIQDEVSFQKIGAWHLVNDILVLFTAKEHFKTVKPWDFNHPVLSAEVIDVRKTFPVKAEDAFVSLFG
jgi:hypothetical protein